MRTSLLTLLSFLLLPAVAFGQWEFDSDFPTDQDIFHVHGLAVDPDGKVWIQPYYASDSVQVAALGDEWQPTRAIYVYNADGTEADFSPIKIVEVGGEQDTLGGTVTLDENAEPVWSGFPGTGLSADHNGNVLVSVDGGMTGILYRLDYETGEGLDKVTFDAMNSPVPAAVAENGEIFITDVFGGDPIRMLDEDFGSLGNAIDETFGFSRGFAVSPDGNTIYWGGFTNSAVFAYTRPDEFSDYDSVGVVIPGMDAESFAWHPTTGHLWLSAGSSNDVPNDYEGFETNWQQQTWYAFDPAELVPNAVPVPEDSIQWVVDGADDGTGRPRAIAFSPDGDVAYVGEFNQVTHSVQRFVSDPVAPAIEPIDSELPSAIALKQNYPNPFNPATTIDFAVRESGQVTLKVYNTLGREVAVLVDEHAVPGNYQVRFDGQQLASGTYLYVLESGAERVSKTMQLIK